MQGLVARWRYRTDAPRGADGPRLSLRDRVLAARGILDSAATGPFLDPKLTQLHDPSLIPDLDRAAERILAAAKAGEPITIYGDYDVDGVTGTAILWHLIKAIVPTADLRTYVPHRLDEGYGLNSEAVQELAAAGSRVIVSVDCGITAIDQARAARDLGVDLIITDHHNPPATMTDLPDAYAVVHPRRPDSQYPFGELSGAGVAYKLAWRLATMHAGNHKAEPRVRELLVELLAFAALGAIADIVPLVGENRVIARHGLVRCKFSKFIGLRALVEASGLSGEDIDTMAVGFRLGPRLNAAGRMGHAREANELFTSNDPARAKAIADKLSLQNRERQEVERRIFEQADEMAEKLGMTGPAGGRAIVLAHPEWHAGVVGIVCSRLVEKHCRPVILMNLRDGAAHGSGRSIEGFNLHGALEHCAVHLDRFGGHNMAAGLHVTERNLGAFTQAFLDHAATLIQPEDMCRRLTIDCDAHVDELTFDSVRQLEALQPCGAGNPESTIRLAGAVVADRPFPLGSNGKHIAIQVRSKTGDGRLRLVAWNFAPHREHIVPGVEMDFIVRPRVSWWQGTGRIEPEVLDVGIASAQPSVRSARITSKQRA